MLTDHITPVDLTTIKEKKEDFPQNSWGRNIEIYVDQLPDLSTIDIAILGVNIANGAINNKGCESAPNEIRKQLYFLNKWEYKLNIVDIGNIKCTTSQQAIYDTLSKIVAELQQQNVLPIIIGGSHDLTYGQFGGYAFQHRDLNLVIVDDRIDFNNSSKKLNNHSFLYKLINDNKKHQLNFSQIGYQGYFVDPLILKKIANIGFDCYRLGALRKNLEEIEPILRNADLLSFDIKAIRQSDAPASTNASPNGFYAEEACQIARYAGMSNKLSSIGFYEVNPALDNNSQTSKLVAEMIWYFVDGYYNRINESFLKNKKDFVKYTIDIKSNEGGIVFWKSQKSSRWWMELPVTDNNTIEHVIPCSYADYQKACNGEMPDRWMQAYQKIN